MSEKDEAAALAGGDLTTVNSSGFPLQLALMHAVKRTAVNMDCELMYVEHAWKSQDTGESGFIDLVVGKSDRYRMVVECKRVRDSAWYFISESGEDQDQGRCTMMKTDKVREEFLRTSEGSAQRDRIYTGWGEFGVLPKCPEALFCVVRGNSETSGSRQALVERLGGELCSAVEAFAKSEEPALMSADSYSSQAYYVPVIVTTAALKVVKMDPSQISLSNGEIDDGQVRDVPFVKLTKQLSVSAVDFGLSPRLRHRYTKSRLRTVYVVRADSFVDFLKEFCIDQRAHGHIWPL